MTFTLAFLPLSPLFTDTINFFTIFFANVHNCTKASIEERCPSAFSAPNAFALHRHTFHSQAVNGAPPWCDDCAGQCAPLCDCMPARLRLSLDTSQPSRPADLYPTVTLSERHREKWKWEKGEKKRNREEWRKRLGGWGAEREVAESERLRWSNRANWEIGRRGDETQR